MKAPEEAPAKGELPLPSPRSPDDLDQRILDYARTNAPRSRPLVRTGWMAGAATACVLVVALLIGGPQQEATMERREKQSGKSESMGEAIPPAAPAKPAAMTAKRAIRTEAETEAAPALSASTATRLASDRDTRADSEVTGATADAGLLDGDLPAAAEKPTDMMGDSGPAIDASWLAAKIREIALLVDSGDREAAQEAYHALQRQCTGCPLPETLEEALAAYPNY